MISLVSVIIPNYNHEKYLKQRIDSVLDQTYQNFEIIILDDSSTDQSKTIIDQYKDHPQVAHIAYNEINSGSTFLQWEKGIALAKGNYIWIAESDDFAERNFLKAITDILKLNPKIGLAYCGSNTVDEAGTKTGELVQTVANNQDGYYLNNGFDECRNAFFFHPIIPNASAVIFKKENFYKVDASFKDYKICGDWQFWIDICFDNSIAYLPQNLNNFRQSGTSVSRSNHHRTDTYKIFLLEKIKVGSYAYHKLEKQITLTQKLKYIDVYLFSVLLESFRKRIFLSKLEIHFISKSLLHISYTSVFVIFKSLADVGWFVLKKISRTVKHKLAVKTA